MQNVASYKESAELITDKKTILMYGLNGTGKSTFSNFFYDKDNEKYKECTIDGLTGEEEILVYNQKFVNDNFYEADSLKGIFTLSKENKKAKQTIETTSAELKKIQQEIQLKSDEAQKLQEKLELVRKKTEDSLWEVKTKYTGGDRVLEFCLDGLKGTKSKLCDYIINLQKQSSEPIKTIEEIKREVIILGNSQNKLDLLNYINVHTQEIENATIFKKIIVGNENSTVANLINELGNSDWVKLGLQYIDLESDNEQTCPFCQSGTINKKLIENIKLFFDESYERELQQLYSYRKQYNDVINSVSSFVIEQNEVIKKQDVLEFGAKYKEFLSVLEENLQEIDEKIKTPSKLVNLKSTNNKLEEINECITAINKRIEIYNNKIENKDMALKELKKDFWENIRWDYDVIIQHYLDAKKEVEGKRYMLNTAIQKLLENSTQKKAIVSKEQKNTVNIDEAIENINSGLSDLGIGDFRIVKAQNEENMYKIIRDDIDENIFKSLSEGEKMIISFLYFMELCKGKQEAMQIDKKKIIVIDDPITSMSHVYIFNVGRLIFNEFLNTQKYEQVFVLTHSLYFFYELTCMKKEDRDKLQKLVRISKSAKGSKFIDMHYQEIQNDYQAYWSIIKDNEQPPALIANCMRNIIEYFFTFVEKYELSNVFQRPSLKNNRFQAFYRYINRESHSLGQNIFDFKEFNYDDFKEAFRLVFVEAGYEAHYKKMMK